LPKTIDSTENRQNNAKRYIYIQSTQRGFYVFRKFDMERTVAVIVR